MDIFEFSSVGRVLYYKLYVYFDMYIRLWKLNGSANIVVERLDENLTASDMN